MSWEPGNWIDLGAAIISVAAMMTALWANRFTRDHLLLERVHRLTDRLYQIDHLTINSPELQEFLYKQCRRTDKYFVAQTDHDKTYFRIKTYIYTQINLWDEIYCVVKGNKRLEETFEFEDWENYILERMKHPLFHELFDRESSIWGRKFRAFIESNRAKLCEAADCDMY